VIIGTFKLGGLPGGHIILLVGIDDYDYIVNDPFGNANTNYKDKNGAGVIYPKELIKKVCSETPSYMSWKT
jgi:uncharacterized protein YvpB